MITSQPTVDPMLGQVLDGRFELTDFIAAGGMGRVYKANQRALDRVVAVKLLADMSDGMDEFRKRFYLEASLCARLSHPNIIRIFDYGCHEQATYYIVMEFLKGRTIKQLIEATGPLQPRRAVSILKQVCAALVEAHDAGLVHRDIKPSNLFTCPMALGGDFVKILDFGVVKQMAVDMEFTQAGGTLGSPLFMSPEQIQDRDLDGRSDLYSLGIVLFQMLTGMLPFSAPNPLQVLMKHLTKAPPRMSEVNPSAQVHECLEEIVHRALQKAPNDRFESARDMLQALADTEASLPTLSPITESDELIWDPDTQALESLMDAPTGTVTFPDFDEPDTPDTPAPPEVPLPGDIDIISSFATSLEALKTADLSGYVAYIDLNCPYCYALHERISCWDLAEKIEWRLVEHASHVLDGPFDLNQEQMLSSEVFEVHHRAPDIELMLPPQRCRSTRATRLIVHTESLFPDKAHALRRSAYRVLWQEGKDIGEDEVLTALLVQHELPPEVLELCEEEPPQLTAWQAAWDDGDYDHSIPVLTHPASGRVLIGLPDERTLTEFLLATRDRVVDSTVCYYQQQPSILICGWMSHIWQLLSDVRGCCEIMQAPTGARAAELLNERAVPDLLVIEEEHLDLDTMTQLADIASARSVPWLVATRQPSPESEIRLLSMGAVEYLPVTEEATVARARLNRILRDRYNLERVVQETRTDTLTGLPTRRILIDEIESEWDRAIRTHAPISFILINLDAFKPYNKTHGYLSGDQCLEEVAKLLKSQIRRRGDLLARFGGNEFAVLLPATEREDAKGIAEQLKRSISEAGIENRAVPGGILTASIGVHMVLPDKDSSIHELVDSASRDLVARRDQPS